MTQDVPPPDASTEGLLLISAVEWLGPLTPDDQDPAVETPLEGEFVSDEPGPQKATVVEAADGAGGKEATTETVDSQGQQETSPAMVSAAFDIATLTARQIADCSDAALEIAARLDPQRVISLLA